MSFWSVAAQVIARVRGLTVVIGLELAAFVVVASFSLDWWEKAVGYFVIGVGFLGTVWKLLIGGDEGPIGLKVDEEGVVMSNIPPRIAAAVMASGLRSYMRRPLPRSDALEGSPARPRSARADTRLPKNVEITEQSLEVPPGAAGLQIAVADKIATDDQADVRKSD